ncbi:hypothetical protein LNP25_28110 [Klebsiella variicola subsp. variicola]|nr:hypothetical protein [Klebsiella variicola subsp. variicola]
MVLFDAIWRRSLAATSAAGCLLTDCRPTRREKIFPGAMNTVVYQGKTLGMPWILDTKYLSTTKPCWTKRGSNAACQLAAGNMERRQSGKAIVNILWSGAGQRARWSAITPPSSPASAGASPERLSSIFRAPRAENAVTLMKTSLDRG